MRFRSPQRSIVAIAAVVIVAAVVVWLSGERSSSDRWAAERRWKAGEVRKTSLEVRGLEGLVQRGPWRNLDFQIAPDEEADVKRCVKLASGFARFHNGVSEFSRPETRAQLEAILQTRTNCFYASFLLATWQREFGDAARAAELFEDSFRHAPVVLARRFVLEEGRPLTGVRLASMGIECNRVQRGSLDPSLVLFYPLLVTDREGWVRVPVYDTVYRVDSLAFPEGHTVSTMAMGWFESRAKVGLLPDVTVRSAE